MYCDRFCCQSLDVLRCSLARYRVAGSAGEMRSEVKVLIVKYNLFYLQEHVQSNENICKAISKIESCV